MKIKGMTATKFKIAGCLSGKETFGEKHRKALKTLVMFHFLI
jgi:hypothetical protein